MRAVYEWHLHRFRAGVYSGCLMVMTPAKHRHPTTRQRRTPRRHYTFTLADKHALYAFAKRQKAPVHRLTKGARKGRQHPNRLRRMERWVLSRSLLALEASGELTFPLKLAHALNNRSPDFMVVDGRSTTEGYEVTQATTSAYQEKLASLEQPGGPKYAHGGDGRGWIGSEPETHWCAMILSAVSKKLAKLAKGHYQNANTQHLVVYDDMDTAAVDLGAAIIRLQPLLAKVLPTADSTFNRISVVTTQNRFLLDVGEGSVVILVENGERRHPPAV
jgi:hypothetical protein